jgi:hypothetical protein
MIKKLLIFAAIAVLFLGVQAGTAGADLVTNGSFGTGDFTGWNLSGDTSFAFVSSASAGAPSGSSYEAVLGTSGATGSISQSITTTAGQAYTVSFWLASDDYGKTPTTYFQALWNGTVKTTNPGLPNYSVGAFDYTQFVFTGVAAANTTTSTISFNFQNDTAYHLTGVSASAVPIPPTVWLFFPSLAGLIGLRSWKSKKA